MLQELNRNGLRISLSFTRRKDDEKWTSNNRQKRNWKIWKNRSQKQNELDDLKKDKKALEKIYKRGGVEKKRSETEKWRVNSYYANWRQFRPRIRIRCNNQDLM